MFQLLMILLGLNFSSTTENVNDAAKFSMYKNANINLPTNFNPDDTSGETQPIPPRK